MTSVRRYKVAVRPVRVEGDVAYVTLTRGQTAVIDAADAPVIGQWNWVAIPSNRQKRGFYAMREEHTGGGRAGRTRVRIKMHRFLLDAPKGIDGEHRDGDGLNNRRANLRLATSSQNKMNQPACSRSKLGVKGVSEQHPGRYVARIKVNGKDRRLGVFGTIEAAAASDRDAALVEHGEFARFE